MKSGLKAYWKEVVGVVRLPTKRQQQRKKMLQAI